MNETLDRQKVMIAAVAAAFLLCYAGVLIHIVGAWSSNYLYSYGFAVPLISGYMLKARSRELQAVACGPDYVRGFALTGAGITMLLAGHLGAVESVESISIVVTALGAVLLLFGGAVFRVAWFPVLYLILGIPVWDRVIGELQVPSQQLSGAIAVRLLRLSGIPAIRDHIFIVLPNLTLEVLRECSGVNQLISVATMALAASFLWLKSLPRRAALLAISVVVAYLSNGVRIAIVGILGYNGWNNLRVGVLHLAEGLAVSLIGYALLFACLSLLSDSGPFGSRRNATTGSTSDGQPSKPLTLPRLVSLDVGILALLLCAGLLRATFHAPAVRLNGDLVTLPAQIADWSLDSTADPASGFRLTGADNELLRVYRHPSGETIRLYVGYHQYQKEGKELTDGRSRSPRGVTSRITLALPSETVELNQLLLPSAGGQAGVLFWYDVNGRILTNLYVAKGYTIWDALTRGRTNAAVVMIEWRADDADLERARAMAVGFADAVVPLLRGYLPSQRASHGNAQLVTQSTP